MDGDVPMYHIFRLENIVDYLKVVDNCDAKAQQIGLEALSESERVVVLVWRAHFEIDLGGLSSFFYNSAGDLAIPTVHALKAVGAKKAASALQAAMDSFPDGAPAVDREQRYPGWQQVSGTLRAFDEEFYKEHPDLLARLSSFIQSHAKQFPEHA